MEERVNVNWNLSQSYQLKKRYESERTLFLLYRRGKIVYAAWDKLDEEHLKKIVKAGFVTNETEGAAE